jgi:hypothetical protein
MPSFTVPGGKLRKESIVVTWTIVKQVVRAMPVFNVATHSVYHTDWYQNSI